MTSVCLLHALCRVPVLVTILHFMPTFFLWKFCIYKGICRFSTMFDNTVLIFTVLVICYFIIVTLLVIKHKRLCVVLYIFSLLQLLCSLITCVSAQPSADACIGDHFISNLAILSFSQNSTSTKKVVDSDCFS